MGECLRAALLVIYNEIIVIGFGSRFQEFY